jgi:nitrogen fixation protein NifT
MEETVASVEMDTSHSWGGEVELTDGSRWYIDPISPPPEFPTTLRFKRGED